MAAGAQPLFERGEDHGTQVVALRGAAAVYCAIGVVGTVAAVRAAAGLRSRAALLLAFALPDPSVATAVAAFLIRPTWGAVALALASVASFVVLGRSHYWLID